MFLFGARQSKQSLDFFPPTSIISPMKLTHEFLNRSNNATAWLFLCRTFDDYMTAMDNQFQCIASSYSSLEEFRRGAFGLFVEFYLRHFSAKYGVTDLTYTPTKSNIDFAGKDKQGAPSTVLSLFKDNDREITMNADHLSAFANISRLEYGVGVAATTNMFVVSNGKAVNETLLQKAPTIKDKITFILMDEIASNVTNNLDFWKAFQAAAKEEKTVVPLVTTPKYILRDFQTGAVDAMLKNKLGQVLLPTGTGKSVIQAEYCKRYIHERNATPVILIVSPRIVLTYQLLNMVFNHLSSSRVDAQYVNLSSGDMEKVSQDMFKQMKEQGLVPRDITATTDLREIKKLIDSTRGKVPLIISATYHSAWRLSEIDASINVILCDEAHNLVMGRFSEDFKEETLKLQAESKFFFTATPCNTPSEEGRGMNNVKFFGTEIYRKPYREMIERNEILPVVIQTVNVKECVLLKNRDGEAVPENMKEADFERDVTSKVLAIRDAFNYHTETLAKSSCDPSQIAPKLLATIDGVAVLKGILRSEETINLFTNANTHVFAISTDIKYYHNGEYYQGYDFKEKFMQDIRSLKETDKAIILHIDMVGEGLDVAGITSVMAFSTQGLQKLGQLVGRAMRLHDTDRKNLYAGKFFRGMNRSQTMVKPYCYFLIPMFLNESQDLHTLIREYVAKIHSAYDWVPSVIYDQSTMIGDNEVLNNQDFKGKHEEYDVLTFRHEIELDNLRFLSDAYVPQVAL